MQVNMPVSNGSSSTKQAPKKDKKTEQNAFDQIVNKMAQANKTENVQKNETVENQPVEPSTKPVFSKPQLKKEDEVAAMENAVQFLMEKIPFLSFEQVQFLVQQVQGLNLEQVQFLVQQVQGLNLEQLQVLMQQVQTQGVVSLDGLQELLQSVQQMQPSELHVQQPTQQAGKEQTMQFEVLQNKGNLEEAVSEFKTADANQNAQTEEFELGRSFRDAVQLVKQMQKNDTDVKQEKQFVDVDALQAQVNAQRTQMQNTVKMQQVQPQHTEQVDVSKQIAEKMLLNLQQGEREFSIKLTPETLGEVIVKLLQKDGKTTLSIVAANESTVKLLNGQLDALKEAVRPMHVEVRQAVVQSQESDGQNMGHQMDMSNGNFFDQSYQAQQQQGQQNSRSGGLVFSLDGEMQELATPDQAKVAAQTISENILDLYM